MAEFQEARILASRELVARPGQADVDDLLERCGPRAQHGDAIGKKDRLLDVVGDEDRGELPPLPELQHQGLEFHARQRVHGAEGLVEQQHLRIGGKRPRDGDTLLHAAGELPRVLVFKAVEADLPQVIPALRPQFATPCPGRALHGNMTLSMTVRQAKRDLAYCWKR